MRGLGERSEWWERGGEKESKVVGYGRGGVGWGGVGS